MQMYLSMFQENPCAPFIGGAAGILVISMLLCLFVSLRYRRKLAQLGSDLAQAHISYAELKGQSEEDFSLQETVQHSLEEGLSKLQGKNKVYKTRIDKLELDRMKVFDDLNVLAQQATKMAAVLADKTGGHADDGAMDKLLSQNHAYKDYIDRLQLGRMKVFNDLNVSAQKLLCVNKALAQAESQANDNRGNQAKISAYKAHIVKLESERMKVFNDLNVAALRNCELAKALEAKNLQLHEHGELIAAMGNAPTPEPVRPEVEAKPPIQQEEAVADSASPVPEISAVESGKVANQAQQLLAKFMSSVKTDFKLAKTNHQHTENADIALSDRASAVSAPLQDSDGLTAKGSAITQLQQELAAQQNYIARLEYDLEVKNVLLEDNRHEVHAVPVAILKKQAEDEARIAELETKLFGHSQITVKKNKNIGQLAAPVAQSKASSWFRTLKKRPETLSPTSDAMDGQRVGLPTQIAGEASIGEVKVEGAAKPLPAQFKGLYQKIAAFTKH